MTHSNPSLNKPSKPVDIKFSSRAFKVFVKVKLNKTRKPLEAETGEWTVYDS